MHDVLTENAGRRALAAAQPSRRLLATESSTIATTDAFLSTVNASLQPPALSSSPSTATAVANSPTNDLDAYRNLHHLHNTTARLGTKLSPHYTPQSLLTNPPSPADVSLELLLASQAHLGHSTSLWNPANSRYIFGIREGIHIISLDITAAHLRRAAKIVCGVAERGGLILFVGTRPGHDRCVTRAAELAGACHLFEHWTPGSITNSQQILGKCRMKVVDEHDREVRGFEDQLIDRSALKPDLVVCLNPLENYVMLHECGLANIPTIGIIDTDANPTWVTYPIPANDDSLRCVQVIAGVLGRAGQEGRAKRQMAAQQGLITFAPARNLEVPGEQRNGEEEQEPATSDYQMGANNEDPAQLEKDKYEDDTSLRQGLGPRSDTLHRRSGSIQNSNDPYDI